MENRLLQYWANAQWSTVLPLQNYPPAFSVVSTMHTLEHHSVRANNAYVQAAFIVENLSTGATKDDLRSQLAECAQGMNSIESKAKALAVATFKALPNAQQLQTTSSGTQWSCVVPNNEPLTAYGYIIKDGNVHDISLVDVSDVEFEEVANGLQCTIHDPDFFAITIESDTTTYMAMAPQGN